MITYKIYQSDARLHAGLYAEEAILALKKIKINNPRTIFVLKTVCSTLKIKSNSKRGRLKNLEISREGTPDKLLQQIESDLSIGRSAYSQGLALKRFLSGNRNLQTFVK